MGIMKGKTCVVTGATDGIGLVAAEELARKGARILAVGRNPQKAERAAQRIRKAAAGDDGVVETFIADLSSQEDVRRVAGQLKDRSDRIDVLLNNAGGFFFDRRESVDGIEMTFALNHMNYFLLTNLLLDRIVESGPSRIVNVASQMYRGPQIDFADINLRNKYSGTRAYQQSKLGNVHFTRELARRLKGSGVTANCLHPGFVRTNIAMNNNLLVRSVARVMSRLSAIPPEEGAKTSVYLCTSDDVAKTSGEYFNKCAVEPLEDVARDDAAARRLWEVSEEMAGL